MKSAQKVALKKIARVSGQALFGSSLSGYTDDLKASWDQTIFDFQSRRAELDQAESALYDIHPSLQTAEDLAEWQSVFSKVNSAKSRMDAVAGLVQGASDTWNSVTGFFGLSGARRRGMSGTAGLGAIPALPISLITLGGLIAAATVAINATYGFITYVNAKNSRLGQLLAAGVDPIEASKEADRVAEQESGYSIGARIEKIALFGAIAVAILAFSPALKNIRIGK